MNDPLFMKWTIGFKELFISRVYTLLVVPVV